MSAWDELQSELLDGECVEAIVFGPWGWGSAPRNGEAWEPGYGEPEPIIVPFDKRGVVLTVAEAEPLMRGWSFNGGFGAPECYAVRIWTNQRVMWVHEYDGSTSLRAIERNVCACMPGMDS